MLHFFIVTGLLAIVGSRVASLVVLEFCLRGISGWTTAGPVRNSFKVWHSAVSSQLSAPVRSIVFHSSSSIHMLSCSYRHQRNFCSSYWFRASSLWDVPSAVVCTSSMRGHHSAGYACSWQQPSAGSWPGRPPCCCTMSWLCTNSTALSATAASASACCRQATAWCPCCAGRWSLLSQ